MAAVPRRFVTAGVLAALGVACALGAGRDPGAAPTSASQQAPTEAPATGVLSVRRVPEWLARYIGQRRLDGELDAALAGSHACLIARDGDTEIERRDPRQPLAAASNQKLLIGLVALKVLGPEFRFETRLVARDEPRGGVVGDVWLEGAGDPLLASPEYAAFLATQKLPRDRPITNLAVLVDGLAAAGVHTIRGAIHGDDGRYDRLRYLPTWKPVYLSDHEIGPLGALTVNDGFATWKPKINAAADPAVYAASELTRLTTARDIAVDGQPDAATAPSGTKVVARVRSVALRDVVADMIRESNNLTAELLVRELGRKVGDDGSTARGLAVVSNELAALGLPVDGVQFIDGSGLDTGNRVTCDLLFGALQLAGHQEFQALRDGLAVAGQSGTLVNRLIGTPLEGKLKAKTGSIAGVVGLTGFVQGSRTVAFAFVADGSFSDRDGRTLQDRVALALLEWPEAPPPETLAPV